MDIIYSDEAVLVCIKPAGVLSTDEPGGVPELAREALGDVNADVRTVHRLDRAACGLMVLARSAAAASILSRQVREGGFEKEYLALVHGCTPHSGELRDLLYRDKARKMSFVTGERAKGVQEAVLEYETLRQDADSSLVRVRLLTGRTHQIRCQFASRGFPLFGERKYYTGSDDCPLRLFSCRLAFLHPVDGRPMEFVAEPEWAKISG